MLKRAPDHPRRQSGYKKVALRLGASWAGLHLASSRLTCCYARLAQHSQRNRLAALLAQREAVASKSANTQQVNFGNSSNASTLKQHFLS